MLELNFAFTRGFLDIYTDSCAIIPRAGITQCITACDRLAAQEHIFVKLKVKSSHPTIITGFQLYYTDVAGGDCECTSPGRGRRSGVGLHCCYY